MSDSLLTDLQTDLAARLEADDFFADIPVLTERKADVGSGIGKALGTLAGKGSRAGVCVILMSPVASAEIPNLPGPVLDIELAARVLENVLINTGANGTGKPALTVARRVARLLHHYRAEGLSQIVIADKPTIVPVEDPVAPLAYEIRFRSREGDLEPFAKVAMPAIAPNSGAPPQTVTLTCATAGAAIHYTLDGSHPAATNPAAALYTAPVLVQNPCTLRAGASKTACVASDTARADYA
jgi:hypothetical protein